MPNIDPNFAVQNDDVAFMPYQRDKKTLARPWAIPGTSGIEHRIGGLEKEDVTGIIFLVSIVIVQNKKRIVNALHNADMKFIIQATLVVFPKLRFAKKFAIITNKGAPGGCLL